MGFSKPIIRVSGRGEQSSGRAHRMADYAHFAHTPSAQVGQRAGHVSRLELAVRRSNTRGTASFKSLTQFIAQ